MMTPLVDLREIRPEAAAYELSPGKFYLIIFPEDAFISAHALRDLGEVLRSKGVSAVLAMAPVDVHVFGLDTTNGAAVAIRYAQENQQGPELPEENPK